MALIGNGSVLHKSPGRFLNGYGTTGGGIASMRCGFNKHGMQRNAYQAFDAKSATPNGHLSPSAWVLPKTAGGMSSHNVTVAAFSPSGTAVGGITANAVTSFSFTVANATGELISSGEGSASFAITSNTPLLTASLSGEGSASFDFAGAAALLAIGDMGAAASFGFVPTAAILPTNDASPLRTGTASLTFSGALTSYALGIMAGSTVDGSVLTPDTITSAVWGAVASDYNTAGSMGARLNSAASGGVDYSAMADAVRTELQAELLRIAELAQVHGLVVGTDLVVTPTSRTAGSVVQTIATAGDTTTVTRSP